jgi:type I restriction enzyme, R subunit
MSPLEPEAVLEKKLIEQLISQGYDKITIKDEAALNKNFRIQLEQHNKISLTDNEFDRVLTHIDGGSVFAKAKKLRDKFCLDRENGAVWLEFFNTKEWCKNIFQVTSQVTMEGKYKNRYDVTILINGLPLVQIELKRRGLELKKAFNQIRRYQKHSYGNLFNYIQVFVISNGVDTKYFANNREQSFKHTFYWIDRKNRKIADIEKFTELFLCRCHISKMIARYIVLHETNKVLMILRPYQYHAVESIIKRAVNTIGNGYVWHTTGSGKTLTSFKASQILEENDKIDKVIFVVDRRDLDYQTFKEFDSFSKGCVDVTKDTASFVKHMNGTNKLIITTIQKLTRAVEIEKYSHKLEKFRESKIIFIFDECHRSQFGEMHKKITSYFNNIQMFGFTGTPIFEPNANDYKTTADVFGSCLHKYLIKDAINDDNVLGFSVEYLGKYKEKTLIDINVEDIDRKEVLESDMRLGKIVDYIINNHDRKTHSKEFNSIFTVPSIDVLVKYYRLFKERDHNLKIAVIYSFDSNEEENSNRKHARECLEDAMKDYNKMFGTDFSTDKFQGYYIDVAKKVKEKKIDILLVVRKHK